jgi:hypothetical protein
MPAGVVHGPARSGMAAFLQRLEKNGPPKRAVPSSSKPVDQFCAGVFSAKYSWLSALFNAWVGLLMARLFAADCP